MYQDKYPPQNPGYPEMSAPYPQPAGVGGSYPPPPAYGMGPPQPQPTVIMAPVTSVVMVGSSFGDTPTRTTCPVCHQTIVTRTVYTAGLLTWLIFGLLLLFGCWLGCCLIPFCVDSCKDVDHYCPNCNHHLSKYKRM
ncbi:hypothetical protein FKM82_030662 [Ascaphus truei]